MSHDMNVNNVSKIILIRGGVSKFSGGSHFFSQKTPDKKKLSVGRMEVRTPMGVPRRVFQVSSINTELQNPDPSVWVRPWDHQIHPS